MKKLKTLTKETYNRLITDENTTPELKEILGIPKEDEISIGDTAVRIGKETNVGDIYVHEHHEHKVFYIVIEPIDEELAYCYSVY